MKILDLPPALSAFVPGNYPDLTPLANGLDTAASTEDAAYVFNAFTALTFPAGDRLTSSFGQALTNGRGNCVNKSSLAAVAASRLEDYATITGFAATAGDMSEPASATNLRTFHAYNLLAGPDGQRVRQDINSYVFDVKALSPLDYGGIWNKAEAHFTDAAEHDGVLQVRRKDGTDTFLKDDETQAPIEEGVTEIDTFFVGLSGLASLFKFYNRCYAAANNRKPKPMPGIVLPRT